MEPGNRPKGRKVNTSGSGKVFRRGSGLNLGGSTGNNGGYSGRPGTGSGTSGMGIGDNTGNNRQRGSSGSFGGGFGGGRRGIGGIGAILVILLIVFILVKCGAGILSSESQAEQNVYEEYNNYYNYNNSETFAAEGGDNNSGNLNSEVAASAREKYTRLKGNGEDTVTVMVYMCGADLESGNAAATKDIQEMLYAEDTEKINLLIYTGGCKRWRNNIVSNSVNQVYKVETNGLNCIVNNAGTGAMTDPKTLSGYIKWAVNNYPAGRYELIFWDHGSGSVGGYGYDEKNVMAGSMTLSGINDALKDAGVKFDFIGFDACLMATLENALMLSKYADYMIASEETEPADGWYYTDWVTQLAQNTSVPTTELGKKIADTYYRANEKYSAYSGITLSLVDLAEIETTVPAAFADFSESISDMIANEEYKTVSNARSNTREFASSSRIDQVDLVDLAGNINNDEADRLVENIKSAVKYNITSPNMSTAYGLSVYFPYRKLSSVDEMTDTYEAIGISPEYSKCICDFAGQQTAGQIGGGGSWNPYGSLFGTGSTSIDAEYGYDYSGSSAYGSSNYSGSMSSQILMELLASAMSGQYSGISGLDRMQYINKDNIEKNAEYVMKNSIDPTHITWTQNGSGQPVLGISEKEWDLVDSVYLNVFYDDGSGYIDLGMDTVYNWDDEGNLLGTYDGSWIAVDGQPAAYYHVSTEENGENYSIRGYIPAFVNGNRSNLLVLFDNDNPDGYIYGVQRVYDKGETDTESKLYQLNDGDKIDFVCDYYTYDGNFENNYYIGEQMTVQGMPKISNVTIGAKAQAAYRITDIYFQHYWTPVISWY